MGRHCKKAVVERGPGLTHELLVDTRPWKYYLRFGEERREERLYAPSFGSAKQQPLSSRFLFATFRIAVELCVETELHWKHGLKEEEQARAI